MGLGSGLGLGLGLGLGSGLGLGLGFAQQRRRHRLPVRVARLAGHPSRLYDDGGLVAFALVEHEPG